MKQKHIMVDEEDINPALERAHQLGWVRITLSKLLRRLLKLFATGKLEIKE